MAGTDHGAWPVRARGRDTILSTCARRAQVARNLRTFRLIERQGGTSAWGTRKGTPEGLDIMWDTVDDNHGHHLSHDMPCAHCGHAVHTYLACSDTCDCQPVSMPGAQLTPA
ncbi:hypothetical protein NLS1_10210 [Nocardioides sp. LS1]|nr:hypothetical protein NLS1_10210 [Nocardioides sp. LS1]